MQSSNTGNQDAHRNGSVWCQNKGRSECYTKWNKRKCTVNQQWREGNRDSHQCFGTKGINKHLTEQNEETRIQKNKERLRNLWDKFKCSNIWIIRVPEGEEEEQEIENFEKIVKKNFPNLVKAIDFWEVQETLRVPKKLDPRKHIPRHIIITFPKIQENERILQAVREKERVPFRLQRSSHTTNSWFLKGNLAGKKGLERSIQSHERQKPTSKITLFSKAII